MSRYAGDLLPGGHTRVSEAIAGLDVKEGDHVFVAYAPDGISSSDKEGKLQLTVNMSSKHSRTMILKSERTDLLFYHRYTEYS